MKSLQVYLFFAGNCEQALNFYKDCLNGEILTIQRFKESPMEVPEDQKNNVLYAEFKAENVYFMASDGLQPAAEPTGNVSLNINFTDENEQKAIFEKLSAGGKVTMPLQDTFWNSKYGMLTDKFGIHWMLNYPKK